MVEDQVTNSHECYVLFKGRPPRIAIRTMMEEVCKHRGHTMAELVAPGRKAYVVRSRQMVMWLADKLRPDLSFLSVARFLGRTDHTTAIFGVGRIERLIKSGDPSTIQSLTELCRTLGIPTIDMARPVRLTPLALEERIARHAKRRAEMEARRKDEAA